MANRKVHKLMDNTVFNLLYKPPSPMITQQIPKIKNKKKNQMITEAI